MALIRPPVLPPWSESGDKVQPTNAEIQAGWPLTNVPPSRQRFNWLFNYLFNGVRYLTRRGVPDWSAEETYEIGDRVQAANGKTYVAKTQNTNQEPSANSDDWERWGHTDAEVALLSDRTVSYVTKAANYTAVAGDKYKCLDFTAAAALSLPPAATVGNGWWIEFRNSAAVGNLLTIDPDGAELVNGATTISVNSNESGVLLCTGAGWKTIGWGVSDSAPVGSLIFHTSTTAPVGYLGAMGQAVDRASYPQADALMYVGDANNATAAAWYRCTNPASPSTSRSTTGAYLVLPDHRGTVPRGLDLGRGLDVDGASRLVSSYQADEVKSHLHTIPGSTWDISSGTSAMNASGSSGFIADRLTASAGGTESRGKNTAVFICVKMFNAANNPALIDITAMANDVALKVALSSFTGSNQNLATSGYQKLPGGLIIQWLYIDKPTTASPIVATWPAAFPTAVLVAVASLAGAQNPSGGPTSTSATKTQCSIYTTTGMSGEGVHLIGIGW